MINVHPSLLPKFGGKGMWGMHVHNAVKEAGEKESGATVHFVTTGVDEGRLSCRERLLLKKMIRRKILLVKYTR
jgi:phosphoribosylglycinamide formyltransferase-1